MSLLSSLDTQDDDITIYKLEGNNVLDFQCESLNFCMLQRRRGKTYTSNSQYQRKQQQQVVQVFIFRETQNEMMMPSFQKLE